MWGLAHKSGQVPSRYRVDGHSVVVEPTVIASTSLMDIRIGKLGGKAVAVKTVKVDPKADSNKSRKVCVTSSFSWLFSWC